MQYNEPIRIFNSFCAWVDLLGYGKAFYDCKWDLLNPIAINNIQRIHKLEPYMTSIINPYYEILFTLNDGVIRNFDIPVNEKIFVMQWLVDVILKFHFINITDIANGFYGARGVITYGNRAQYRNIDSIDKYNLIYASQETKQTGNKKNVIYTPSELQMNTAFSKAYIIESGGSKSGLKKNKIHIDEQMLDKVTDILNDIDSHILKSTYNNSKDKINGTYLYNASFNKNEKIFKVTAHNDDIVWECLKIEFDDIVSYKNDENSLTTNLYIPKRITDAIYKPDDIGELELDYQLNVCCLY